MIPSAQCSDPAATETLDAEVRAELARGAELDAQITALLTTVQGCPEAARAADQLQNLAFESIDRNDRLQRLAIACETLAARKETAAGLVEFGRQIERDEQERRQQLPRPRKGAHGKQPPIFRALKGGLAALGAGAAFKAVHAAAGQHAAMKLTAAAVTLGVPTTAVAVTLMLPSHTLEDRHGFAGGSASPAAVVPGGTWLAPQQQRLIAAFTRPTPKGKAAQLTAGSPSALPLFTPSSAPDPDSAPAAGGRDQDSSPASQAPGQLELSTSSVDLSENSQAKITLTASGGMVDWQATEIPAGISLSWPQGRIWAGMSYTVTVSRTADLTGTAPVVFEINGVSVSVYLPAPVVPTPDPSPSGDTASIPDILPSPSDAPAQTDG